MFNRILGYRIKQLRKIFEGKFTLNSKCRLAGNKSKEEFKIDHLKYEETGKNNY